jgi:Spy/CpxP family protein refolding chaperone
MILPSHLTFRRMLTIALFATPMVVPGSRAGAQTAVGVIPDRRLPESVRIAAAKEAMIRLRSPSAMALLVKQELMLSPKQVAAIEALVPVEAESVRVRTERASASARQNALKARARAGWTGPIDEAAIRAEACEQSRASADMLIGAIRDRHALGRILTPDQQRQFDRLQPEMTRRLIRQQFNK